MMRKLSVILVMLVTVFIGFGLIIPVLPLMVQNVGAQPFYLGLMLALYSAVAFFISPWWGRLSDRIGRKPILITGLFGFAVSFVVFGLASHLLWLMFVARIIGGGFSGAVTATAMAYVADVTEVEDRTKGMAMAGVAIGLGFIFGPALGGILGAYSVALPFFVAGGLAVANAVWGMVALKESLPGERRNASGSSSGSRWEAFAGALKYLYVVDFVAQFSITALEGCLQYFELWKINAGPAQVGGMFFISGIVGAIIQGGYVRRVKHGQEARTMQAGLLISGLGLFLLLFSTNFWTASLYMTIFGAGNTVIKPTLTSVITKETTVGQGLASGLLSSMDSLARMVGPLLATFLYEINKPLPFIVNGVIAIASISLVVAYKLKSKHDRIVTEPV